MRQRFHPLAKTIIVAAPGFVTDRHSAIAAGSTHPPSAHLVIIHQMHDSFRLAAGRRRFFPKRSFKAAFLASHRARNPLKLRVLVLPHLEPLGRRYFHAAVFVPPFF